MSPVIVSKLPDVRTIPLGSMTAADAAILARIFPPVKREPVPVAAFNSAI
jgi:FXSXX-COOH protein